MTLVILALAAIAFVTWRVELAREIVWRRDAATPNLRPELGTSGLGTEHQNCSVALCDSEVALRIYASGEFWPMCLVHGMPYLTEGLPS